MRVKRRRQELVGLKTCMSGVEKGFMAQYIGNKSHCPTEAPSFWWLVRFGT